MDLDLRAIAANIRKADTKDLLNRVTVYRDEMEPAAVDLIEGELARRGLTPEQIEEHGRKQRATALVRADGTTVRCRFCDRPAVVRKWGWHRLWGVVPVFPMILAYCRVHQRGGTREEDEE